MKQPYKETHTETMKYITSIKTRVLTPLVISVIGVLFSSNTFAGSGGVHSGDHAHVVEKTKPTCTEEHATMGHCEMEKTPDSKHHGEGHHDDKKKNMCTEEHAAMGHCEMEKTPDSKHHGEGHHDDKKKNMCTEEHAAMGHCKMDKTSFHGYDIQGYGRSIGVFIESDKIKTLIWSLVYATNSYKLKTIFEPNILIES